MFISLIFSFNVKVLEATSQYGGRIRSENIIENRKFSEWPLELGGEEIHGENSYHNDLALLAGGNLHKRRCLNDYITHKSIQ